MLIADDEHTLARSAQAFLTGHGFEPEVAGPAGYTLEQLSTMRPHGGFAEIRTRWQNVV